MAIKLLPPEFVLTRRESLGATQKEFARLLGMGLSGERTVGGWERGEHSPTRENIELIDSIASTAPFRSNDKNSRFRFIDLFAGIGGIRLPFQQLGGTCVFSSEWDKFAQKTYAANFGEVPKGDITLIPAKDIETHDLLLAGFPCQAFSQAGLRKGFADTRGTMFFEIQRILAYHRPKAFLLENVKQLKGHDSGRTLKTIIDILNGAAVAEIPADVPMSADARLSLSRRLNYQTGYRVFRATDFGVPQKRERVYFVGFDRDIFPDFQPELFFDRIVKKTGCTRLGDILEENDTVDPKYTISDRLMAGHSRRLKEHKAKGNGFGFSLFDRESPACNTISARYYKDGSEVLIDQSDIGRNPRKLTPREAARAQGFPEEYRIDAVSDVQAYRQFGNSVTVPVIRALADQMVERLAQYNQDFQIFRKANG